MAKRYLIVSDLHLADIEDHSDGWKAYKHSRYLFDKEFDHVVGDFVTSGGAGDQRTLILNGDIIDFDLVSKVPESPPWPVSRWEKKRGLDATEEKSVWKLHQVLIDHPQFLSTLARFTAAGHSVVYVIGNHDAEFHFSAVRQAFVDAVHSEADRLGITFDPDLIQFERWFYYVPEEIYVEHGQQYDNYTSFRYVLAPFVKHRSKTEIAVPMGNLSNRYLMPRMGFFNPHATDFIMNVFRYISHWFRYYAFTNRALVRVWLFGSLSVLFKVWATRREQLANPPDCEGLLRDEAANKQLPLSTIKDLDNLKQGPISNRIFRVMRELWIDRLILLVVFLELTFFLLLANIPFWAKVIVPPSAFVLLFYIYEWIVHGDNIFSIQRRIPNYAFSIAELLSVKLVSFGHTHEPELIPLLPNVSYVNSGTWAPVPEKKRRTGLVLGRRNIVTAVFETNQPPHISLDTCLDERLAESLDEGEEMNHES